jgi:quercetin dioxygenase-like cupin family protein
MSEPTTVHVRDVDSVEMMPNVFRRTLATGNKMMISHVTLKQGGYVPLHHHPHEQVGYVIEGRMRMTIGSYIYEFEPGDSYSIPSHVEHDATGITDCVVLDIFCPPREEYR